MDRNKPSIDRFGRKVYGPYLAIDKRRNGKRKLRRHVITVSQDGKRKNMSFARWLMEQHLGRELSPSETVDHQDENTLNDSLDNFAIMSHAENCRKHSATKAAAAGVQ